MKTTAANYETLIVIFAEPIRTLDNIFDAPEAWGVEALNEWIDSYISSRFTQTNERTAVITSEYNMNHIKVWLEWDTLTVMCTDLK